MSIIKSIIEKLKLKECFGIIFVAALLVTFMPTEWAQQMKIVEIREEYQTYISLCIIVIGSYYVLLLFAWFKRLIWKKTHCTKRIAINYMKKHMSQDEMLLLIDTFYDERNQRFCSSETIDFMDGRVTPLKSMHIIYLASRVGTIFNGLAYNLQPYVLEYLNRNLLEGNIVITDKEARWKLK